MTARIGREYEVLDPIDKLALRVLKSDELIEYSDTSDVSLFSIPANTVIVGIACQVTTAFDAENISIIVDDGTTAGLFGTISGHTLKNAVSTTSNFPIVLWPFFEVGSTPIDIKANVSGTATAGVTKWWLLFRPVSTDRTAEVRSV